jgi:hypothetical protein
MRNRPDDDELLAALRAAVRARAQIPPRHVASVKDVYARTTDAELARLTFDSSREPAAAAATRSESASIRALTFTSEHLTIEVEVAGGSLIGQVIPAHEGIVEVQAREGATTTAPVDGIGCFCAEPIPPGPFRLRFRNRPDADVVTGWITL